MRLTRRLHLACCGIVIVALGLATEAFAASQGEVGRSSSATLQITLRIHAEPNITSAASVQRLHDAATNGAGFVALHDYCAQGNPSATLRHGIDFKAQLLDAADLDLAQALGQVCRPQSLGQRQGRATLVIAPL